jgi:CRISPR/Cas system-associated endonuclease Cas1
MKELPRFIKVNGHVYRLAADPKLDALKEKLQQQKQQKQDAAQQQKQEQTDTSNQMLDKLRINVAGAAIKAYVAAFNEWATKEFKMPPPTKGDPNNKLHAFVAFKDAFTTKSPALVETALAKAAELLQVPVTASTRKR